MECSLLHHIHSILYAVYSRIWFVYVLYNSLMGQNEDYKFDIYTDFSLYSALGITHGIKGMEDRFPTDRILKVIDIDVVKAEANVPHDAKFIKNAINGNDKDAEPLEHIKMQIATIISTHRSLNHVLLRKSKISDNGVIKLLDAIKVNKSMEHLELYDCEISHKGNQRIEKIEHKIRTHRKFKLSIT